MGRKARANLWNRGYQPKDGNWMMCQLCGLQFRASAMRRQPHGLHQGLWVCPRDFEKYNPQFEDIRGVPEKITPNKTNHEPDITTIETNASRTVCTGSGDCPVGYTCVDGLCTKYTGSQKITADDL